jgi:type IV pilus assembly protein PilB
VKQNAFTIFTKRLLTEQILSEHTLTSILIQMQANGTTLIDYLLQNLQLDSHWLAKTLSDSLNYPFLDLDSLDKAQIPLNLIPEKLFRRYPILPLWKKNKRLAIGIADPTQLEILTVVQSQTASIVLPIIVAHAQLQTYRKPLLDHPQLSLQAITDLPTTSVGALPAPKIHANVQEEIPLIRYVNQILQTALHQQASDIHFEPEGETLQIRFRIDGILYPQKSPPDPLKAQIMTRLKIMGSLDITEQRLPQDGRFQLNRTDQQAVDCRISTCPTTEGEKIVIRLLNNKGILDIAELGLNTLQQSSFLEALKQSQGMILVTGPTGSGKSLTLYSALQRLNTQATNIMSVEDPVEIRLTGINQVNIHPQIGLNFATVLRGFLRQDPDVLMIGEMRDRETAEIGIQAAQTGHLVLSTLHTNSAAETLTRLGNMGIPAYNIAASIKLIIAQRLVRCLCSRCKRPEIIPTHNVVESTQETEKTLRIFKAKGCPHCIQGYQGRTGIFELLPVTETIAQHILAGQSATSITKITQEAGMVGLTTAGFEKVKAGLTSLTELNRII